MRPVVTRWLVVAGTAAAVLAGGLDVFAQSGTSAKPPSFVADVASHLGVAPTALQQAIAKADLDHIAAAQAAGRLTAAQAQKETQAVEAGHWRWLGAGGGTKIPAQVLRRLAAGAVRTTATYTGLAPAKVRRQLRSGQTLAQVAASVSGKSAAGLEQALDTALQARLQKLVAVGHLSQTREQSLMAAANKRLPALLQRHWHLGPKRWPALVGATARYTGLSQTQVRTALRGGKSLDAIAAGVSGKSAAGLEQAVLSQIQARLQKAVSGGHMTAARQSSLLSKVQKLLPRALARTPKTAPAS